MRSWVIGNSSDCDVVVDSPLASARHCQLTQTPEGFVLNDLGSTNGTYVNGVRIAGPIRLNAGDSATLGRTVPCPWPPELTTSIRIGRLADNDIVLDDPRVSGHHARLLVVTGLHTLIEDTRSSNGTFLNSPDHRVTLPTSITGLDTLYFGTLAVPAARLLGGLNKPEAAGVTPPIPAAFAEEQPEDRSARLQTTATWHEQSWLLAWLAQAPVFAVLIVLFSGRQVGAADWETAGNGIAATTFALALAAIWLGGSLSVAAVAARQSPLTVDNRLVILGVLCSVASAILLAGVYWGSGLKGPWLAMWGLLVMTSLVGFFLGLAITHLLRITAAAISVLLICFMAMVALGGWLRPLPRMFPPMRIFVGSAPSRWAFEGLFLLETAQHLAPKIATETDDGPDHDFVEGFFPANSERMGVTADAMALGSMLVGLAALSVFISGHFRPDP